MQKRIEMKKLYPNFCFTWENYDAEYACKILEWCRGRRDIFPCCVLALRPVVLSQNPSCSVERLFSRLKIVEDAVEENMNNDMLELIIFLQCNGDLSEILGGIPMVTVS